MTASAKATPRFIQIYRMLRLGQHLLYGVTLTAVLIPWLNRQQRNRVISYWSRGLMRLLNMRLRFSGVVPEVQQHGKMVVSNHISWLDIFVVFCWQPVRFVAKSEVRSWPLIGWMCANNGTLFVERGRKRDAKRVNGVMGQVLLDGECIGFFPEGTTSDGSYMRPFNATLMQAATATESELIPIGVRFLEPDDSPCTAPAYIDDMSLIGSMWLITSRPHMVAELVFAPPVPTAGSHRRVVAEQAERAIATLLSLEVRGKVSETPVDRPVATLSAPHPTNSRSPAPADSVAV